MTLIVTNNFWDSLSLLGLPLRPLAAGSFSTSVSRFPLRSSSHRGYSTKFILSSAWGGASRPPSQAPIPLRLAAASLAEDGGAFRGVPNEGKQPPGKTGEEGSGARSMGLFLS
mmetsp:Transcript_17833/g.50012  ORF Transcript_17833/g.50012 Transcript_17833/m.50012 type:complete len:113 (+) Transcript_17833:1244-1582(+)